MSSTTSDSTLSFSKLGESNHSTWSVNMKAYLMQKKVWGIVSGVDTKPAPNLPDLRDWLKDQQAASGYIFLGLEDAQKTQVQAHLDNPKLMWETLQSIHVHKHP